ncbi:MAG: glycosyltransferase family 39 protein [Lachnospiraceae bacterium]|nr:glycosyltransferase family 39 protein [Lachnospiraceae bacterium]
MTRREYGGLVLLLLAIAAAAAFLLQRKRRKDGVLIFTALTSLYLRFFYILYTPTWMRQHDVIGFGNSKGIGQAALIEWIYHNGRLPDFDPRKRWGFFQPLLHHILSAVWLKINTALGIAYEAACENIQILTLIYSLIFLWYAYRTLKEMGLSGTPMKLAFALTALHPSFILMSGSVNNDMLCLMFLMMAIYYSLVWYRKSTLGNILKVAVCIGCSMMAKLMGVLIAPAIAFLFLHKLYLSCRETKRQNEAGPGSRQDPTSKDSAIIETENPAIQENVGSIEAKGDLAKGHQTKGNLTKGNLAKENLTKGNLAKENLAKGNLTKGNLAKGRQTKGNLTKEHQANGDQIPTLPSPRSLIGQFLCFGGVSLPLGLFFPIRNLVLFGVPLMYVPKVGEPVGQYGILQRIFDIRTSTPYTNLISNGNPYDEFNIPLALMKTSLTGEYDYGAINSYINPFAWILLGTGILLAIVALWATVRFVFLKKSNMSGLHRAFWGIIYFTAMAFYIRLVFSAPYFSSQDFRYIAYLIVPESLFLGLLYGEIKGIRLPLLILTVLFSLSSTAVYFLLGLP